MAFPEERAPRIYDGDSTETEDIPPMGWDQRRTAQENVKAFKQLEMLFENCQSLLGEMRDVTVQVAGNIGDISPAVKVKHEPRMLELQLESFELRLLQERERSEKKIQAMRTTCQNLVLNMAKTVKEYFKKTIEDTRRQHRKELERARREGIQEGMRRQRRILQKAMACTHCSSKTPRLFLCGGCWSACYCGEACQRSHWPTHMESCRGLGSTSADSNRLYKKLSY